MGIMGVAGDPLTFSEGLGVGSSLYLPVQVPGAKFFTGDPHYVREGAFALEAPLRATFRLTVLPAGAGTRPHVAPYWVDARAPGRHDAPLAPRVARLPRRGARGSRGRSRSPT